MEEEEEEVGRERELGKEREGERGGSYEEVIVACPGHTVDVGGRRLCAGGGLKVVRRVEAIEL